MSPKTKRRLLLSAAVLLVLSGLVWWSRSGPTELNRYKAQLLAQGEILDIDKLAPIRTGNEPDGDRPLLNAARQLHNNLQLKPDLFLPSLDTNNLLSVTWSAHPKATNQTQRAALWQQAEADVEMRRGELAAAGLLLQQPPLEKGGDYRDVANYPRINFILRRTLALLYTSAVLADAHAGRSAPAITNLHTLLDLCDFQREEWTLINQMIRVPISQLTVQTLAYGLAAHTWEEPELARVQARLESLSLVTNTYQSLLFMRAEGLTSFAMCRTNTLLIATNMFANTAGPRERLLASYWASVNADADEMNYLKLAQSRLDVFRQQLHSPAWARTPDVLRSQAESAFAGADSWLFSSRYWLSSLLSPNLNHAISTLITTETLRVQAITAIALERHRLKQGCYPDSLSALIPDYLTQVPLDPMDGHPLRYRVEKDGTFTLWSVGFDGKDNGADPRMPDSRKQSFPQDARDLVWPRLDPVDLPPKP